MFKRKAWRRELVTAGAFVLAALVRFELRGDAGPDLAEALRGLDPRVFPDGERADARSMLRRHLDARRRETNRRDVAAQAGIASREDWERFRRPRLDALRRSLALPEHIELGRTRVTGEITGDGYRIVTILYESRPELWVPANLYLPAASRAPAPGIIISHSHHRPKVEGELQDMGILWARAGCAVLVPDHVGHGERADHPFRSAGDYAGEYRWWRQDYCFRYDSAIRLEITGESLMGVLAGDLLAGAELLRSRADIDSERVVLLGAVAGGGDPAAIAGALDERIAAVVPFNFGGPQPETVYPLPADAASTFEYLRPAYWESSRNLPGSGSGGFLDWVIVASIAPRGLIYAHEFSWDRARDPVWRRLERTWGFYEARDRLAAAYGKGLLRGSPPEASHCTNIGRFHRCGIHLVFERWFGISVREDEEPERRDADELRAWTGEAHRELAPKTLGEWLDALGAARAGAAHRRLHGLAPAARRDRLREEWRALLGPVDPRAPEVRSRRVEAPAALAEHGIAIERVLLGVEPGITVPLLLVLPSNAPSESRRRVAVGLAQSGKAAFLARCSRQIAVLLEGGVAVCLPDLRGTGETREDESRSRRSASVELSATSRLFGETLAGARLRDLRSVLAYLRTRSDIDPHRISLWGDSFAPVNGPGTDFRMPRQASTRATRPPHPPEPLGALLALLGVLYEEKVRAVYAGGGLATYRSVLRDFFVLVPHDAVVQGAAGAGDLPELAAALAPRPLRIAGAVDGRNQRLTSGEVKEAYSTARETYAAAGAPASLSFAGHDEDAAAWLLEALGR